jgi:protein TonB
MEQIKFPVRLFAGIAIVTGIYTSGCNNNSQNAGVTPSTDTSSHMMTVDSNAMNSMKADSGAMAPSATDTAAVNKMKGAAKPNAAKKGLKGKTVITLPAKMSGAVTPDASGTYANVDYIPSFPGGNKGLQQFFDDNLVYPAEAEDNGVDGVVNVTFTIDENGKLIAPTVAGANQGYGLDQEALRVVNKMPNWNPGKVKGKPVKTKFVLPVRFQLQQ